MSPIGISGPCRDTDCEKVGPAVHNSPTILLVDDSRDDREQISRVVLKELPNACITIVDGPTALAEAIVDLDVDLVITDYDLYWASGLDVVRQIMDAKLDCPVLMVTGSGDESVAVEAMKLGVFDYVLKSPSHLLRLPAAIQTALAAGRERRAARDAENRYRTLFDQIPIGLYRTRRDGTIIAANPALASILGYASPEDAVGHSVVTHYDRPQDREELLRDLDNTGDIKSRLLKFRRCDKTATWVEISARLHSTLDGETVLDGALRDVGVERMTRDQLYLHASALEAVGEAIMITDHTGLIEWVNPSFTTMTGYSMQEIVGQNPSILKSGKHDAAFFHDLWTTILSGREWRGELQNLRKDGHEYTEHMTIAPVRDRDGVVSHFVSIKRDITEQRTLEAQFRQAQKMEAVGQLAGGIAHDFNNLLTVILGYADILSNHMAPHDRNREDVEEIRLAASRASSLTRQLLAFSRRQILSPSVFDARDSVRRLEQMLQRLVREDVRCFVQTGDEPAFIMADMAQIDQVLVNLVINASDAMPNGGRLVVTTSIEDIDADFVRAHKGAREGRYATLRVRDTGVGMDADTLARVFEPFFTTKPMGKGTGLGLSMVYGVVKQSQGFVWIDSSPGRGTEVTVHLPLAVRQAAADVADGPAPPVHMPERITVLVMEDDAPIRDLVGRVLGKRGFKTLTAANGTEALEKLAAQVNHLDLLITDIVMPDVPGPQLARALRARYPDLAVIFMSGYHDPDDSDEAARDPRQVSLSKPFGPDVLLRAVHDVLAAPGARAAEASR